METSCLEEMFGKITWPIAVMVVFVALLIGVDAQLSRISNDKGDEREHELDVLIVQECANAERPKTCAEDLREMMD